MKQRFGGECIPTKEKNCLVIYQFKTVMPKGDMVFPMSQHIGAPAKPIVNKGDKVLVGQKIGEASGFISANICCSVSGTVKAVEPRMLLNGSSAMCVVVEMMETTQGLKVWGKTAIIWALPTMKSAKL